MRIFAIASGFFCCGKDGLDTGLNLAAFTLA
jgi:hypothetical protein